MIHFSRAVTVVLVVGFLAMPLTAQEGSVVSGTVRDSDGAGVEGAVVTVLNTETNVRIRVTSDVFGNFSVPGLEPGSYTLNMAAPTNPGNISYTTFDLAEGETRSFNFRTPVAPEETSDAGAGELVLSGIVMVAGTREPSPNVRVSLIGPYETGLERALATDRGLVATTDARGRFRFTGLAAGRYDAEGGEVSRKTVEVGEGLQPEVQLWVQPSSNLSGRVLGPEGAPVRGAAVSAARLRDLSSGRQLVSPSYGNVTTDEDGRYSLAPSPGEYLIRVRPGDESIATHYYPGVSDVDQAMVVRVSPGSDQGGMNVPLTDQTLLMRSTFRLRFPGRVPGVPTPLFEIESPFPFRSAPPLAAWIRRLDTQRAVPVEGLVLEPVGDDVWRTPPLVPGQYEMMLSFENGLKNQLRNELGIDWKPLDPIASIRFTLDEEDLDLGSTPEIVRVSLPGRVIRRTALGGGDAAFEVTGVVFAENRFVLASEQRSAVPDETGAFVVDNLYPGLFQFYLQDAERLPDGWYVASVTAGGQDVLKEGLLVGGGTAGSIEVVLANDGGRIEGVARDSDGQLVPDARIVLIPPQSWRGPFRRFPMAVADARGAFLIEDIPPGTYRLLAMDEVGRSEIAPYWESPQFLREFETRADAITVDAGAQMVLDPETVAVYP